MSKSDRMAMLDRRHEELSVRRQCMLLGLSRATVYRPRTPANDDELAVMHRLDELFLAYPFLGGWQRCCGPRADPSTASGSNV